MKKNLTTILQGMIMGIAEIIPGVSGSTLALIMGIYEDFIDLLHDVSQFIQAVVKKAIGQGKDLDLRKQFFAIRWGFGLLLLVGMLVSIAVASSVIEWAIAEFPHYLLAIFTGLIISSVVVPWRQIEKVSLNNIVFAVVSAVVVFLVLGLRPAAAIENPSYIALFFGGAVAISGMVLPGVSGSFILLLVGLYEFITGTIKELTHLQFDLDKIMGLAAFALGLVVGFMGFVKVLKIALERWRDQLMAIITGLMIGSLRVLWPFIDLSIQNSSEHVSLAEYGKVFPWEMAASDVAVLSVLILLSAASVQALLQISKPNPKEADVLEEELV